jgi:predicted class III extradiol MEMO1 family dioxygenase
LCIVVDVAIIFFLFCDFSKRVFLLGPSHHYYTPKCALSTATVYKTPIGDLPIDLEGSVNHIKYEWIESWFILFDFNIGFCLSWLYIQFSFVLPVNEQLKATGKFETMDIRVDEAEHSMEMHLPYLAKVFEG